MDAEGAEEERVMLPRVRAVARMLFLSRPMVDVRVVPQQEMVFHETVGEGPPSSTAAHGVALGYPAQAKTFASGSPAAEGPVRSTLAGGRKRSGDAARGGQNKQKKFDR